MLTATTPNIYDALEAMIKRSAEFQDEKVRLELDTLLDYCQKDMSDDSEKFLTTLIINALKEQNGHSEGNLYLNQFEIPQIELFSILIDKFPFVKYSQRVVNYSICETIGTKENAVIVDIGIGLGIQMLNLVDNLKENKTLKKLTIIGIEPSEDALNKTVESFKDIRNKYSFEVDFIPVNKLVEEVSFDTLKTNIPNDRDCLIFNESLALHHIQSLNERYKVLVDIRIFKPDAFFLVEPNVNHYEPELYFRFQNCYRHFYNVFEVIDKLDIGKKEKNGLKLFFGREISDILGKDNDERYEKHEPAYRWVEKLQVVGFKTKADFDEDLYSDAEIINIKQMSEEYLAFNNKYETVLAVIKATI
jgi:hypothetical protein